MPLISEADEALVQVILHGRKALGFEPLTEEELATLAGKWESLGRLLAPRSTIPHLFLTINLDREKSLGSLYQQVLTLTPRVAALCGATAVIECVPHPHCHILLDRPAGYKKSNLIRSIQRALKLARPELVDVQAGRSWQDYNNRRNYLEGTKSDPVKAARQEQDKELRDKAGIPHLFTL